jgi:hypothetical protein
MAVVTAGERQTRPMTNAQSHAIDPNVVLSEEDQPGFSQAELLYLLTVAPGETADFTAAILGLDAVENKEILVDAGASALLARRSLVFSEDQKSVVPHQEALMLAYVLTNATRWTTFGVAAKDSGDSGFLIEAEEGRVLAQPRAINTWWFIFLDVNANIDDIFASTAIALTVNGHETAVYAQISTPSKTQAFTIHRTPEDWSYAWGVPGEDEPQERVEHTTADVVAQALNSFSANFDK